jgi:uncharacterized protein (TIGR01777 family)
MRVLVTGATGTIGRAVIAALLDRGDRVVALSRDADRASATLGSRVDAQSWRAPTQAPPPEHALSGADAVINLLGESIAQRWSPAAREEIRASRVLGTRQLVAGLRALPGEHRPTVLVSQSASGFYGPRGDEQLDETAPAGDDFLAHVVVDWESEAKAAPEWIRVVTTRTGLVLSPQGGALAQMLPFFRLGVGGPVGSGRQYVPWIHLDDVVGALLRCVDDAAAAGPVNLTAPEPVTNRALSKALGRALHRPAFMPVPPFALRALYGEMSEIVLTGQRAVPAKLQQLGYSFRHTEVESALRDVLASRRR